MGWGGVGHVNVRVNLLKRCKNDGSDSWACLNLFEAEIAFRLGEIHIYLKNHQIQTSEFQSFCDRWIVFSPRRNDDFLKKTVFHDLTFRSAGIMYFDGHSQSETLRTSDLYLPSGNQTLLAGKSTIKWHWTAKIIELNGKCSMLGK